MKTRKTKVFLAVLIVMVLLMVLPLIVSANETKRQMINETSLGVATIRYFVSPKGEVSVTYMIRGHPIYEEFQEKGEWQAFVRADCCRWLKGTPLYTSVEADKLIFFLCIGKEIKKFEFSLAY